MPQKNPFSLQCMCEVRVENNRGNVGSGSPPKKKKGERENALSTTDQTHPNFRLCSALFILFLYKNVFLNYSSNMSDSTTTRPRPFSSRSSDPPKWQRGQSDG